MSPSLGAWQQGPMDVVSGIPCRSAVFAGLTEQEPQLLQPLTERVFGRHYEVSTSVARMTIGVVVS
jgi:hypothetical protein